MMQVKTDKQGVALDPPQVYSSFGEQIIAELIPVEQLAFHYNINTRLVTTQENDSGTVTQANGMASVSSGAAATSAATLVSNRVTRHNAGQGIFFRGTALFTTGAANSEQLIGIGDVHEGFFWGYNGTAFGVLRRDGGQKEIQTLTVTTGAASQAGDITINLDSVAVTVAVANADSTTTVAQKIAAATVDDTGSGWTSVQHGQDVIFLSFDAAEKTGTFSLVDTDSTGCVGSFSQSVNGASATDTWVAQTAFSEDVLDGTGPSGMTLDPTKGNVFFIQFQWGFGAIQYCVEDSATGRLVLAHKIEYGNANTTPSVSNPDTHLYVEAKNTTNTTDIVVKTASISSFIEGIDGNRGSLVAATGTTTGVTTTELPLVSVFVREVFNSKENHSFSRLDYLTFGAVKNTGNAAAVIIRFRVGANLGGTPAFADLDTSNSILSVDSAASSISGGEIQGVFLAVPDAPPITIDTIAFDYQLPPGTLFTITAEAVANTVDVTASLSFTDLI